MGTRSRIGVMHGDVCKSVYCHWDGYLEHNGVILQEHYDSARANNLVALGDLSSLGPEIGEEHPFGYHGANMSAEEYNIKFSGMCTFYGRDRGESGTEFKSDLTFDSFFERAEGCGAEWYYIMKDGVWYVGNTYKSDVKYYQKLVLLSDSLSRQSDGPDSDAEYALMEKLGLDRSTPTEDLVAHIENLDKSWDTVDL